MYRYVRVFNKDLYLYSRVLELSPIEVAIDEMETRVRELSEIVHATPTDIKKLQLKLQGSISVQVRVFFLICKSCSSYKCKLQGSISVQVRVLKL